ncbi:hypothetical protein Scani_38710 [Streptomyces caniferus]|uniref:Uncharacterized protein n=1 Tax=Streptomyces caniferus TaxID=285557 RepID=A0A640S7Z6_9ACTN|nr:hypothetical protein Scani_38710 [Streptomyces caniferus]
MRQMDTPQRLEVGAPAALPSDAVQIGVEVERLKVGHVSNLRAATAPRRSPRTDPRYFGGPRTGVQSEHINAA